MSYQKNYFGKIKPLVSECCITDSNIVILCTEIVGEEKESMFSSTPVEDENTYLRDLEERSLYEENCIQILDAIPLESDDLEESEMEYYDSLINM